MYIIINLRSSGDSSSKLIHNRSRLAALSWINWVEWSLPGDGCDCSLIRRQGDRNDISSLLFIYIRGISQIIAFLANNPGTSLSFGCQVSGVRREKDSEYTLHSNIKALFRPQCSPHTYSFKMDLLSEAHPPS